MVSSPWNLQSVKHLQTQSRDRTSQTFNLRSDIWEHDVLSHFPNQISFSQFWRFSKSDVWDIRPRSWTYLIQPFAFGVSFLQPQISIDDKTRRVLARRRHAPSGSYYYWSCTPFATKWKECPICEETSDLRLEVLSQSNTLAAARARLNVERVTVKAS